MPTCSEAYGAGWTGTYPNCTYSPSGIGGQQPWENLQPGDKPFTGDIDYGEEFKGTTLEDDWRKYFDLYPEEEEEMLTKAAGIDVGQLESAWALKGRQLGEGWGLKREELGTTARTGYGQVRKAGSSAARKSDLAFSGTIADIEREKRGEVTGAYEQAFGLGQTAYEQAMQAGQLGLQQATTDIYQGLETGIYGLRKDWKQRQRDTLNVILAGDIYEDGDIVDDPNKPSSGAEWSREDRARMQSCQAQGGHWDNNTKTCDTNYQGGG